MGLTDVAIRWEHTGWVAYNVGRQPAHAAKHWSTHLGAAQLEEVFDLFRDASIIILPALAVRSRDQAAREAAGR